MATTSPPGPEAAEGAGIRYTDRVFVGGINESGKSTLLNVIAAGYRCQVLLYDTKDEFTIPGVEPVHTPEGIDWNERVIHVIDDKGDIKETDRLFKTIWQRKAGRTEHKRTYGLVVVVHELADLCADQPGATPQWVSVVIRKGRAHKIGVLYGSQRPRNIPRVARTEAQHAISMARGFDPEDIGVVAGMHKMTPAEFEAALAQASRHGDHAAIWYDKRARRNVILPPLSPEALRNTLAHGIDGPDGHAAELDDDAEAPENSRDVPELSGEHEPDESEGGY